AVRANKWAAVSLNHALDGLGILASERGLVDRAQEYYERSLAAYRKLGDQRGVAMLLNNIGAMRYRQGEHEAARTCLEESLTIQREIGNHRGVAIALINLGHTARAAGSAKESRDTYRSAMAMLRDLGDRAGLAEIAEGLAYLVASQGGHAVAATLLGAAQALRAVIGVPIPPADRREYDRAVQTLRTALRDDALQSAWDKGRTMPIEQSLELALGS
ncbi:MAG: tetratricopeptide repeat protein, partial [Acidobacteria bacterium]|nr:tetratricopeptide repeat protein [Acidobacteriota bacterium]